MAEKKITPDGSTPFHWDYDIDCLIVDKVFAACHDRKCFASVEAETKCKEFGRIKFRPGFIVPSTLQVTPTNTENFRRVRFTLKIPFWILDCDGKITSEGVLPPIEKDIIMYIPTARDEFEFKIVVETESEPLLPPVVTDGVVSFTVGTLIIIKVVGKVQLRVPAFGYCEETPPCDEFKPDNICDILDTWEFQPLFPPQLKDPC